MQRTWLSAVIILSACLGGCASLGETIQQRVAVAETCRQVMQAPLPEGAVPNAYLASIRMGDVGSCTGGNNDGIIALCAYDQIEKKYQGSRLPWSAQDADVLQKEVSTAATEFKNQFNGLKTELRKLAYIKGQYDHAELMKLPPASRLAMVQSMLEQAGQNRIYIGRRLVLLRESLATLRTAQARVHTALGEQAAVELAAWDSNVRIQLEQLEQVLTGNVSLIISETLKDQVVRHVAKRSLDLLHGALKPAQAVIDRLDDKAYGLISVSYLAFQPNLQDAVNNAYDNVKAVYNIRLAEVGDVRNSPAEKKKYVDIFIGEMRRAACENLVEGSKFSMVSELVDTMLINKVQKPLALQPAADDAAKTRGSFLTVLKPASFMMADGAAMSSDAFAAPVNTPLSVYVSNEWAARQQLLIQSISERRKMAGADAAKQFPGVGTVDEGDVRRLADAATARVIDDASRANPALLDNKVSPHTLSVALSSNVDVVVATSAVSQANAVLMASISNVNTFNPSNNNAPVFNLPAYPAVQEQKLQQPSLCATSSFGEFGASCISQGGDYIIVFDRGAGYASDACEGDNVRHRLAGVAGIVRDYGNLHRTRFDTSVAGYASLKRATLHGCKAAKQRREVACTYRNRAREELVVAGCARQKADDNLLLSAARAKHAAAALEQASEGALLVRRLSAGGAQAQDEVHAPYVPAAEQTVVLRFRPSSW